MDQQQIELVVFDWAGTTVDYGSSAPSAVFGRVFSASGIHLTRAEINAPMGMEKKAHIRQLLSCASGKKQWAEKYGRPWNEADVERLYEEFEATLSQVVEEYSAPLPGVPETLAALREMGLKIGSTTGYNARIMEQVIPKARALGYAADCVVTPDVTGEGPPLAVHALRMHAADERLPAVPRRQSGRHGGGYGRGQKRRGLCDRRAHGLQPARPDAGGVRRDGPRLR